MNLIEEIARGVVQGLSKAENVARLKLEHAVEVSEDWVHKIMSADGFSAAVEAASSEQAKRSVADVKVAVAGGGEQAPGPEEKEKE